MALYDREVLTYERPQVKILEPAWRVFDEFFGREVDLSPVFDHEGDSGRRLYAVEEVVLVPFVPTRVRHGVAMTPSSGYAFDVRSRSGSMAKKNISVTLGTIDAVYSGELCTVATYMPPLKNLANIDLDKVFNVGSQRTVDVVKVLQALGVACYDPKPLVVARGERISQLVELLVAGSYPGALYDFDQVDELPSSSRGDRGFNSTSEHKPPKEVAA